MVMNDCNNDYNMMINQTKYKTDSNKVIRNTGDDIGKDSSSHITKNISVTGIDEALAHAIFTSDVDNFIYLIAFSIFFHFVSRVRFSNLLKPICTYAQGAENSTSLYVS